MVSRARKIQRFFSQPFFVVEDFTGIQGNTFLLRDTIQGFSEPLKGKYDHIPEQAFFEAGTSDDVIRHAEEISGVK